MSFTGIKTGGASSFEPLATGTYTAVISGLVGLGKQRNEFKGEVKVGDRLVIFFEIIGEDIEINGDKVPKRIFKESSLSFHEKAFLTKVALAADPGAKLGSNYDIATLVGKPVQVQVGLTTGGNPKVTEVIGLPKGMNVDAEVHSALTFNFYAPEKEAFELLPLFLKKNISKAVNLTGSKAEPLVQTFLASLDDEMVVPDEVHSEAGTGDII